MTAKSTKLEDALHWTRRQGMLLWQPPLASWLLSRMVQNGHLIKIRKDLYLVAEHEQVAHLSPLALAGMVEPAGYISFQNALAYWGIGESNRTSVAVSPVRRAPIHFGRIRLHFLTRPLKMYRARVARENVQGVSVRIATPEQAMIDLLSLPEMARAGQLLELCALGLQQQRLERRALVAAAVAVGGVAVARRLGLLLEILHGEIEPELFEQVRRSHTYLLFERPTRSAHVAPRWLLRLDEPLALLQRRALGKRQK